ncbi:MAG: hypothetical protein QOC96_1279 [Acidobacteriota bacterium]|jgi:hypothetical protein|nr:hypothetical protein [Acidobacteriota bacterium]
MLTKAVFVLIMSSLLFQVSLLKVGDRVPTSSPSSYVKLEVRGILLHKEDAYYIQANDPAFSDFKLLVRLERSEDKNRALDQHLQILEGKTVIARGFLDGTRITQGAGLEVGVIGLRLNRESQVEAAGED